MKTEKRPTTSCSPQRVDPGGGEPRDWSLPRTSLALAVPSDKEIPTGHGKGPSACRSRRLRRNLRMSGGNWTGVDCSPGLIYRWEI
ncbi:hypothetical protein TNCV_2563351 [Trichonephila clavipes]|uniref:Uncharacterized protein n=1 Tax=Trichonephila clavipes TaxID=2585209 RepID=A0A8X6UNW3_TRICX|nr:hypothetical protein TNCV_2563351 [Trichonephila clavipes]